MNVIAKMLFVAKHAKRIATVFIFAILVFSLTLSPIYAFTYYDDYWNDWRPRQRQTNTPPSHDIEHNGDYNAYDNGYYADTATDILDDTIYDEVIPREPWLDTRELPPRQEGLNMAGVIPVALSTFGESYQDINQRIDDVVTALISDARRMRARSIYFSHEWHETEYVISIVIYASISSVINRTLVRSVNFCPYTGYELSMLEATESGMVALASRILNDRMRRQPEQFYAAQTINLEEQTFFINNNGLTILFDEFQLSAMVSGYVSLELATSNIRTATITAGNTYTPAGNNYNLIMVPFRAVSEQLGFHVSWDAEYDRAELWSGAPQAEESQLLVWLYPGVNAYHTPGIQRRLEAAPYLSAGSSLYVPITFFIQMLQLSAYSMDSDGSIYVLVYSE